MRRVVPVLVLIAAPILGIVLATVIASQAYPTREVPVNASHTESLRIISEMFEDASTRGLYMLWGGIGGAAVGVIGAIGLYAAGKKEAA